MWGYVIGRRVGVSAVAAALAAGVLAPGAFADPGQAKNSIKVPLTCAGSTVEFIVISNGDITPGHVVGDTRIFLPQSFDLTFIFTPPGGPSTTETFTPSKKNGHGDLVTCNLDWTRTMPDGTVIVGFGTLVGVFTPASGGSS
jgi:hypothetical protein